jgi:hypothetical protein
MPHEAEVTSLNTSSLSCVDMSKKKQKEDVNIPIVAYILDSIYHEHKPLDNEINGII